ncbi:hypothetical protein CLV32_0075 [Pedobacter duraquae]|uniref:Uncharacterized protein n=1 Tax=Pedobacter duraquae TaxID=425511 RepID=A0A4R6INI4_9SPHI|nr:hypothetical protein CLV32_0075 [Pedobacter duraquae]
MVTKTPSPQQDLKTLIRQRDFFKGILIGVCILWPFIFAAAIYFYYKKGNIALFIPSITILISFLPIYLRLKALSSDIKAKEPS